MQAHNKTLNSALCKSRMKKNTIEVINNFINNNDLSEHQTTYAKSCISGDIM